MASNEKNMEILLGEPFGHYEGHQSGYPKYLSRALAGAGANVTMASFEGFLAQTEEDAKVKHISVLYKGDILALLARFVCRFLRLVKPLRPLVALLETTSTLILVLRQNRKQRYGVIHILDASLQPLSFLALASIVKNSGVVLTISGPPPERYSRSSLKQNMLTRLDGSKPIAAMKRSLYRRATKRNRIAFVCHSKQVQDSYADSMLHDRLACIAWGMESGDRQALTQSEARQYLGLPREEKLFLSFGINHPRKNFEVVFQAVQDLPRDFKLLFAGEIVAGDAKKNDPRRFAREHGWLDNTIIVDKYIPEEETAYYFYAADAIILSYTKDFIGASGILSHSSTFNLPVIASDVGQLGEFVKSYRLGLTFIPEDHNSLREAILSFLELGEEEKQTMKRNLAQFASAHSWEQVAKEHLELYQSLAGEAI